MFKALKTKLANYLVKKPEPVKTKEFVPFDLIVGSYLKLDTNSHIIYRSKCKLPDTHTVTAIGKSKVGDSTVFRIYISDYYFLQIITNDANQIEECRIFYLKDTVYPSTALSWKEWLEEGVGLIGKLEFKFDNEFYLRMSSWADDDLDWVPPVTFTETIGNKTITHQAMAYGRWLNEDKRVAEFLLVSSDSMTSSESINIYIGIDINPNEVVSYF